MTTERHLVCDPATGNLVRDPATRHLVYAAISSFNLDTSAEKDGSDAHYATPPAWVDESIVMADAVAAMKAADYGSNRNHLKKYTRKQWTYSGNETFCSAACAVYRWDTSAESGKTIKSVRLKIANPQTASHYAVTYRLKLIVSSSSSWATSWTDIAGSPQFTGSTNGDVVVTWSATLSNYLFCYLTDDSWSAPAVSGAGSRTESARLSLSEATLFVEQTA